MPPPGFFLRRRISYVTIGPLIFIFWWIWCPNTGWGIVGAPAISRQCTSGATRLWCWYCKHFRVAEFLIVFKISVDAAVTAWGYESRGGGYICIVVTIFTFDGCRRSWWGWGCYSELGFLQIYTFIMISIKATIAVRQLLFFFVFIFLENKV